MQWIDRLSHGSHRQQVQRPAQTANRFAAPGHHPISLRRRVRIVAVSSIQEWMAQRAASKGAALAFYTLFSLAPVLVLVIAIAGSVFGTQAAQGELFTELSKLVGPTGAQAIQALLASVRNPEQGKFASLIATIFLIVGATTAFTELKESLDEIWHVSKASQSGVMNALRTRLLSFGLVLMLGILLLISLLVNAAIALAERHWENLWALAPPATFVLRWITTLFSFGVIACLFAVIYKMLPQVRLSWRDVWVGALGTAGLFTLGKYAIGLYLGNSDVANGFGAAGSLVALLLWLYYSAQIFFLGAEFTRQYALWFGSLCQDRQAYAMPAEAEPASRK